LKQKIIKSLSLPKLRENRGLALVLLTFFMVTLTAFDVTHRSTVSFTSVDSLKITADEYFVSADKPYIILLHEQGSSRGEFKAIAQRLCKMDFNCLAVDLRNGGNSDRISNETARRCRDQKCTTGPADVEKDIKAAIEYACEKNPAPVILFGCGANASLSLKVAAEDDSVRAVVALSPGEYFQPELSIQDTIASLSKPAFVASSKMEFPYVSQLVSSVNVQYVTLFQPQLGEGKRGSAALSSDNENQSEYWFALLLFFKELL
jgi:dienelactone hydrolase